MLVDEIALVLKGGDGGEGKISFGKLLKSGPDGGNGGDGGNLILSGSSDLTLLSQFHPDEVVSAEDGIRGEKDKKAGRKGEDRTIKIPIGTEILDLETGEKFELKQVGDEITIAKGGKGGIGNFDLRSPSNTTPKNSIPAQKGETRKVKLTLRFIADFGLIGLPSAGKSSLLNELTNAKAKTGEYHFTTLSPNLGVLPNSGQRTKKIIADIPGLIQGASEGKGLGIKFLKHIEKVGLLLHCISAESENPLIDYEIVRGELEKYSRDLLKKEEVIVITKSDLLSETELREKKYVLEVLKKKIISVSIYDDESLDNLITLLRR